MRLDLYELVKQDHDYIDRLLSEMLDPVTAPKELSNLLEMVQLALAVHTAAQTMLLDQVLALASPPSLALYSIADEQRIDHATQRFAAQALQRVRPGSIAWFGAVQELRAGMLDHSAYAIELAWLLRDHVPLADLGGGYARQCLHASLLAR